MPSSAATSPDLAVMPQSPSPVALSRQARRLSLAPAPWLHEEVARRLADKLAPIRLSPRRWVDWSAHLGAGRALVDQAYPQAQRWVVEPHSSFTQVTAAAQPATPLGRVGAWVARWAGRQSESAPVWVPGQADAVLPPWGGEGVDLLWANMSLHTSADLPGLMAQWHRCLAVDGLSMASGRGPDTARELRSLYAELGWGLPTVQFVDMHDLGDELVRAGFADPVMDMERLTLTWATPEALVAELRTWGGNVAHGRFEGCRTPRWRERLHEALRQRLTGPDGRLRLTVELVYAHAVKPVPRAALAPETRVSLDDMRQMVRRSGKS